MILVNGHPHGTLPAADRGFAYGDGVFRTLPVGAGRPRHWARHFAKLEADCAALGIVCCDADTLLAEVVQAAAGFTEAVVRITITRGSGPRGYAPPYAAQPLRVVAAEAAPAAAALAEGEGVVMHLCRLRLARQPALAGIKHLNRLENVLARREWNDVHVREGLLCDSEGLVIGGTMSNLFIVEGSHLATPRLDQCGVAGVTRARVMALARGLDLGVAEEELTLPRVLTAEAVFLVNSVIGLWPVAQLAGASWPPNGTVARVAAALEAEHG